MKSMQLARFTRTVRHLESESCRNCNTHFNGKFCPECGQEADTGAPIAMGFIYEFLTRNVLEKGKLPRTIWHLLRYPGGLTVDFLEGRRARYIRPVRLYLIFSIVYFLLLSFQTTVLVKQLSANADAADVAREVEAVASKVPVVNTSNGKGLNPKLLQSPAEEEINGKAFAAELKKAIKQTAEQAKEAKEAKQATQDAEDEPDPKRDARSHKGKSDEELKKMLDNVHFFNQKYDALIKQEALRRIKHFSALSQHEQINEVLKSVINQAPKTMFFLVPVFAMLLKLFFIFRGIPYGAHLLFSVHYHALAFLVLMGLLLPLPTVITGLGIVYICLYLPVAMRTTYLCSWIGALARCFLLSVSYSVAIGLAMAGTLIVAVIG